MTTPAPEKFRRYEERIVPFQANDGMKLNLIRVRGDKEPTRPPVLLVHGAGVRANVFRAPVETNFVDALLDAGYDVWLENWRASIDVPRNEWTLDQAAAYDHPAAVKTVVRETGVEKIKAVIHCQGSTSFTMSAIAGLIPEVDTIVSNAVSLHTVVPKWSRFKLSCLVPVVRLFTRYLNPHWGVKAPGLFAKLVTWLVQLSHWECRNSVCKMVSFTYGAGFPALWRHENLNEASHEWLKEEFGDVPISFFAQMSKCVRKRNLISVEGFSELPRDFAAGKPQTEARFAFFTGEKNRCFLPDSQRLSYEYFSSHRPNFHKLHVLEKYSHLDLFMGEHANEHVFPRMIQELGD